MPAKITYLRVGVARSADTICSILKFQAIGLSTLDLTSGGSGDVAEWICPNGNTVSKTLRNGGVASLRLGFTAYKRIPSQAGWWRQLGRGRDYYAFLRKLLPPLLPDRIFLRC